MLTLYHAPNSRSDTIVTLTRLMGIRDTLDIVEVTIPARTARAAPIRKIPTPKARYPI